MNKHSKSPWRYTLLHRMHHTVVDANNETVAFDISTYADAHLIEQAPALLAALEAISQAGQFNCYSIEQIKEIAIAAIAAVREKM